MQKTGVLTSLTLLIFGCGQFLHVQRQSGGSIDISTIKFPAVTAKTAQAVFLQICLVALPIFASLKVGGFVVAFALLLAIGSGVPALVQTDPRNLRTERYNQKIFTIALLAIVTLLSISGLNKSWDSTPFMGYLALIVSIFVLPPPFPTLRLQGPIPEPGLVSESISQRSKTSGTGQPAALVTTDASLALVSGFSLAVLGLIISRGIPFELPDIPYLLIPGGLFAIGLMRASPSSLRSGEKVGLGVFTAAAALLCSPHIQDDLIFLYPTRGALAAASFFASRMDDSRLRLEVHSHNHSHHHHGHSHSEGTMITRWLVSRSEAYPLLHSILKEKDSRSIFYFMW